MVCSSSMNSTAVSAKHPLVRHKPAALGVQSTRPADDAGKVAELEAAQAAAQGALLAEMDLLRRQKAAAEEQARRMETQVNALVPPFC